MHGLANLTSQFWQMASALNSRNIKVMLNWSEGKRSGQCLRCCICRFKIYSLLGFVFPKLLCWWPTGHLFTVKFLYAEHCVHLNHNFHLKKPLWMNEWIKWNARQQWKVVQNFMKSVVIFHSGEFLLHMLSNRPVVFYSSSILFPESTYCSTPQRFLWVFK